MSRNLKALGLALLAAFALSAVAASAASAHIPAKFTSGSHWTKLNAKALTNQIFKDGELEVICESIAVHGSAGTEQESITVEPTFGVTTNTTGASGCVIKTPSQFPAQVHTNGCHLLFTAGGTVDGEVHITCPPTKEIEVTIDILGAWRPCLDIPEQTPTKPTVDYTNETEVTGGKNVWDVRVKSTVEGITYTKTGVCGETKPNTANYTGEATVWGTNTAGEPVDVTWDKTVA